MTITFAELQADRSLISAARPTARVSYLATSDADATDVEFVLQAEAQLPSIYAGLPRLTTELVERLTPRRAVVTLTYGLDLAGLSSYAFEIGTASEHITRSLATVASYGPQASDAESGNINWDGESVNGLDIDVPIYEFSETHQLTDTQVTPAYKAAIYTVTARVNLYTYKGFAPGELLFKGCSGSKSGNELWSLTFRFAASPNMSGIYVGDIGPITKAGWDYLWVSYARGVDDTAHRMVPRPVAVYVERVYPRADFSVLGI